MSINTDISKLDDLIITTIDSIRGYEHSADHADAGRYAHFFRSMAGERRNVVARLQSASRTLGGIPADYGSTAAAVHRRWEDLRHVLGGGDEALVKEVERGEDYLLEEFERALGDDNISAPTRALIKECHESVLHGHDRASALKHQFEAAH
jgi:uncharacterized protein (TIGR02284 family)